MFSVKNYKYRFMTTIETFLIEYFNTRSQIKHKDKYLYLLYTFFYIVAGAWQQLQKHQQNLFF